MISPAVGPGGKGQPLQGQTCISFQRERLRGHLLTSTLPAVTDSPTSQRGMWTVTQFSRAT